VVPENSDGRVSVETTAPKVAVVGAAVVPAWREDDPVEVRYPLPDSDERDRSSWPWLPGTILAVCGPDEWQVCVEVRELATPGHGRQSRHNTPDHFYPVCFFYPVYFRNSSKIRARSEPDERVEVGR
jgi:hypothetical protein